MGIKIKAPKIPSLSQVASNPTLLGGIAGTALGAGTAAGGAVGGLIGATAAHNLFPGAPNAPGYYEDPRLTAIREKLNLEAKQFRNDLPGMKGDQFSQIDREGSQILKTGLDSTRKDYNRRGLLYSGFREGSESALRGRVASTIAQQKVQAGGDLEKLASAKESTAAQVGLDTYADSLRRQEELDSIRLQNSIARSQVLQQMGQTAGYLGGSLYANRSRPSTTEPVAMDYSRARSNVV